MFVCVFKNSTLDSDHILKLSLSELSNQLKEGLLDPEDVFYSYVDKVQHTVSHSLIGFKCRKIEENSGKTTNVISGSHLSAAFIITLQDT